MFDVLILLVILVALVALDMLAYGYGADSRKQIDPWSMI
jgi:hypothetical protein